MESIWNFVMNTFSAMQSTYLDVITWFSKGYQIGNLTFTVSELLFGAGLITVLGIMVVKFIA